MNIEIHFLAKANSFREMEKSRVAEERSNLPALDFFISRNTFALAKNEFDAPLHLSVEHSLFMFCFLGFGTFPALVFKFGCEVEFDIRKIILNHLQPRS